MSSPIIIVVANDNNRSNISLQVKDANPTWEYNILLVLAGTKKAK